MLGCRRPPRELPSCSTPCSSSFSFLSNSTVEIFFARQKREAIFARYINRLCRLRSCMFEKGQMKIVLPTECFRCGCRIDLSTRGKRVKALCVCVCVCVCVSACSCAAQEQADVPARPATASPDLAWLAATRLSLYCIRPICRHSSFLASSLLCPSLYLKTKTCPPRRRMLR